MYLAAGARRTLVEKKVLFEVRLVNLGGKLEPLVIKETAAETVEGKCNFAGGGSLLYM